LSLIKHSLDLFLALGISQHTDPVLVALNFFKTRCPHATCLLGMATTNSWSVLGNSLELFGSDGSYWATDLRIFLMIGVCILLPRTPTDNCKTEEWQLSPGWIFVPAENPKAWGLSKLN